MPAGHDDPGKEKQECQKEEKDHQPRQGSPEDESHHRISSNTASMNRGQATGAQQRLLGAGVRQALNRLRRYTL
jgi:hypothetical protein